MNNYPFTPLGVQDMQAALYALTDTQLELVAQLIETDFGAWVTNTFQLDPSQLLYLDGMNATFLQSLGQRTALAVRHRLPLVLIKPEMRSASSLTTEKFIITCDDLEECTDGEGLYEVTGSLTVKVEYP